VGVRGLLNIQFALMSDILYVIEANPRASRTVPFASKATGVALARAAALIQVGETIESLRRRGILPELDAGAAPLDQPIAVKEAVLPFKRFRTHEGLVVDSLLGPEMRSTGEVMGLAGIFSEAFAKSQAAVYSPLPTSGTVFVSVADRDKRHAIFPIKRLADLGFEILATAGTASVLQRNGVAARAVRKHSQGPGPNGEPTIVQLILDGQIAMIFNTPNGYTPGGSQRADGYEIRTAAILRDVSCMTTVQGLAAAVQGIEAISNARLGVRPLQAWAEDAQ